MWSFARANFRDEAVLGRLSAFMAAKVLGMQPKDVAQICWAFAKLDFRAPRFFNAVF